MTTLRREAARPLENERIIFALETSCDETAAAVVTGRARQTIAIKVRSNIVATQHDLHARYAGVVPEIASRAHLERILPVVEDALRDAGVELAAIDAVAVGNRPGLIGSLLVGVSAAKALAWSLDVPLIGVDHIHAHLVAGMIDRPTPAFPALGLVVSGGHTSLFRVDDPLSITQIGRTIDDAIGEAFDKAATILDLGYPGGPAIDALARHGDDRAHDFPIASLDADRFDFSFSGLKTSLLYAACGPPRGRGAAASLSRDSRQLTDQARADFAASFQRAAVEAVIRTVRRGLQRHEDVATLLVGGGVSANSRLRKELRMLADELAIELRLPDQAYCLDNAAMIGALGLIRSESDQYDDLSLAASSACTG